MLMLWVLGWSLMLQSVMYRSPIPLMYLYNVDITSLEVVREIKDLGIIVDRQMSWKKQVHDVVKNARRTLGFIKVWMHLKMWNANCTIL